MKTFELLSIIGSIAVVGIALAAVVIGSNANLRAEMRTDIRAVESRLFAVEHRLSAVEQRQARTEGLVEGTARRHHRPRSPGPDGARGAGLNSGTGRVDMEAARESSGECGTRAAPHANVANAGSNLSECGQDPMTIVSAVPATFGIAPGTKSGTAPVIGNPRTVRRGPWWTFAPPGRHRTVDFAILARRHGRFRRRDR